MAVNIDLCRPHPKQQDKTIWDVFLEERKILLQHSAGGKSCAVKHSSASKTCLVGFDRNHYREDHSASPKKVDVRAYADRIEIYHHDVSLLFTIESSAEIRRSLTTCTIWKSFTVNLEPPRMGFPSEAGVCPRPFTICGPS